MRSFDWYGLVPLFVGQHSRVDDVPIQHEQSAF